MKALPIFQALLSSLLVGIVLGAGAVRLSGAETSEVLQTAARMVEGAGISGGVCSVVNPEDASLPMAVAKMGTFVVHCVVPDAESAVMLREQVRSADLSDAVSAGSYGLNRLPYQQRLINILIIPDYSASLARGIDLKEIHRALAPLGTAYLGLSDGVTLASVRQELSDLRVTALAEGFPNNWVKVTRGWPPDIDQWTHYLHGADGNPVAEDQVVGPPKHYQWISKPLWLKSHETDSSISTIVSANGRLFYILDEAPISLCGDHPLPDKWSLVAQDAFNGVILWKVPIRRWGWREWKLSWFNTRPGDVPLNVQKRLVAVGDKVYVTLGYQAPVSQLDARTGQILQSYAGTEKTGEILYHEGTLILSAVENTGVRLRAVDADSGKTLWVSEKTYGGSTVDYVRWRAMNGTTPAPKLDPSLNMATDGASVAFIDGADVVALDFGRGTEKWRTPFPQADADRRSGGISSRGTLWIGTMIAKDGVIIHAGPNSMAGLSSSSGDVLWTRPKKYIGHLWYEWKDVFVIDGLVWTWGHELERGELKSGKNVQRSLYPTVAVGCDIQTGEVKKEVPLGYIFKAHHHHRCYRNKATAKYILASRRGTEYVDLQNGKHTVHNWVRGTCHVGMMPANGLQYATPHPCACYIDEKLNGMNALAPLDATDLVVSSENEMPRVAIGPAFGKISAPAASEADWPMFRCNALRSGASSVAISAEVTQLWQTQPGRKISAPIAVGDRIYMAEVDGHHLLCFDAGTGEKIWEAGVGGRIDTPPTYHEGALIVGCRDGYVYCFRATDGASVWTFRAAPADRLIGAFGQLESAWPVIGSVLVQNDLAYFVAGRTSELDGGMVFYALDAATGEIRHQRTLEGPDYTVEEIEQNFQLPMGALPDVVTSDGNLLFLRSRAFNSELVPQRGGPKLSVRSGYLDDTYFKRVPWRLVLGRKGDYARIIVYNESGGYFLRMFDSLRGLDPSVYFVPGKEGYLLFANQPDGKRLWQERVPMRARAMAVTPTQLYLAGPPDVIDPKDPLGAFEGRKGGLFYVVDAATGKKTSEFQLPSPPVFNGVAVAQGRIIFTLEDGATVCYGAR